MKRALIRSLILLLGIPSWAQASKVQYVTLANPPKVTVTKGRVANVALAFTIQPNVHINSNRPSSETLIPTELTLQLPDGLTLGKLQFPPGHDFSFPFAPAEKLNVYTNSFSVTAPVRAGRAIKAGEYHVSGVLGYQACNDRACFPPKKLPVEFDITVRAK